MLIVELLDIAKNYHNFRAHKYITKSFVFNVISDSLRQ